MPTCVFRDGPHICGETALGSVPVSRGGEVREIPACERHLQALAQAWDAAGSSPIAEPEHVVNGAADTATAPAEPTVQVAASDQAGSTERA